MKTLSEAQVEMLRDIDVTLKGLSLEIEAARRNNSSSTDFILYSLDRVTKAFHQLVEALKPPP